MSMLSVHDRDADVRDVLDKGMGKLKDWLDIRLQRQEDILQGILREVQRSPQILGAEPIVDLTTDSGPSPKSYEISSQWTDQGKFCTSNHSSETLLEDGGLPGSAPEVVSFPRHASMASSEFETVPEEATPKSDYTGMLPGFAPDVADKPQVIVSRPATSDMLTETGGGQSRSESVARNSADTKSMKEPSQSVASSARNTVKSLEPAETSNLRVPDPNDRTTTKTAPGDWQSKWMDLFEELDLDGSGCIGRAELLEAFQEVGLTDDNFLEAFNTMDKNDNGNIDRIEWLHFIARLARGSHISDEDARSLNVFVDRLVERCKKTGHVYKTDRHRIRCRLRHDSIYRMAWDIAMSFLLFYISISVPFLLGFGKSDILEFIDRLVDVFFCIDVVLNFRTTYIDNDETVVTDGWRIAKRYLKTWFLLDVISSFPFDLITSGLLPNLTPARLLKMSKIMRVVKLLRLSRLVSTLAESDLMERIDSKLSSRKHQTVARLMRLVAMAFIVGHWLACFGSAVDSAQLDSYFAGGDNPDPSSLQRYLAGMYWSMTTLSTVGFGDITPKTDQERAYTMFAMVVGGSLYGYVIGSVTSIVTDTDMNNHAYHERMELVQSWLDRHEEFPAILRRRVRKHFKRALAVKSVLDDGVVINQMSPELRADSAFFILHDHVRGHAMFSNFPGSALAELVEVLQQNHAVENEFIVKMGNPGIAMYILVHGIARYDRGYKWHPPGTASKFNKFQQVLEGDSFGEEIIFGLAETYSYTVVTVTDCEFHSISEDQFRAQFHNLPELRKQMCAAFLSSVGIQSDRFSSVRTMSTTTTGAEKAKRSNSSSNQKGRKLKIEDKKQPQKKSVGLSQNPNHLSLVPLPGSDLMR